MQQSRAMPNNNNIRVWKMHLMGINEWLMRGIVTINEAPLRIKGTKMQEPNERV